MENITSIKNLLKKWDSRSIFAHQIGQNTEAVHKWAQFNRIPAEHQASVVRAAQEMGLTEITAEWMIEFHSAAERSAQ